MKKTELPCAVVEDLLPSYLEGLTSAETNAAVEDHLASCPACAAKRAAMGGGDDAAQAEQAETAREVDYLKAVRRKGRRRVWLAVLGTLLGPNPEGAAYGHGHYGWAIWGGVFLLSMPAGALLERRARQRRTAGAPAGENEKEAPPGPDGAQHLS